MTVTTTSSGELPQLTAMTRSTVTCLLLLVGEVGRFDVAPSPSMSNTPTLKFWGRRENRILRSTTIYLNSQNIALHLHT